MNRLTMLAMAGLAATEAMPDGAAQLRVQGAAVAGYVADMELCEGSVADAQVAVDERTGEAKLLITLREAGVGWLASTTGDNLGRPIEVVLDGKVIAALVIQEQIVGSGIVIPSGDVAALDRLAQASTGPCKSESAGPE